MSAARSMRADDDDGGSGGRGLDGGGFRIFCTLSNLPMTFLVMPHLRRCMLRALLNPALPSSWIEQPSSRLMVCLILREVSLSVSKSR